MRLFRRGVKATQTRHDEPRRGGGKHTSKYNNRREFDEYSDDEDDYSDSQQEELFDVRDEDEEESIISWDQRRGGDRVESRDDVVVDDEVDDEAPTLDEFGDGEDEEASELVTRDQVLDELRAQAAADALGKSLEQMGYNLDNCDSFYSLSETEKEDQRYNIGLLNSEVSDSASPSKRRPRKGGKKKKKPKKKAAKSPRSRYIATSDEEDEEDSTTLYGDPTTTLGHHSFGDYETFISTSSDDSDADDSYYEDETSYTTGQVSALTGKTSKFSRFTGKKSAKTRKSLKTKLHKKRLRGGDHETYYSRGTEWTPGEESSSSTLSSVSDSELDSELDLDGDTMYTELSRKRDRALKKKMSSRVRSKSQPHTGRRKPSGKMKGIDEDMEYGVSPKHLNKHRHHHPHHHPVQAKQEKKNPRKKITRPTDASIESDSSMIGAMRSLDSTVADEDETPPDADDKQQVNKTYENNVKKTPGSPKGKKPKESVAVSHGQDEKLLKTIAKNSSKKIKKDEVAVSDDALESPKKKSSPVSKMEKEMEASDKRDGNEEEGADPAEKNVKQPAGKNKRRFSKSMSASKDDGSVREQKDTSKQSSDDVPDEKDLAKKVTEKGKIQDDKKTGNSSRPPMPTKDTKGSEEKQSTRADKSVKSEATGSTGKKFWPRQFLSLRKKKNDNVQVDYEAVVVEQENPLETEEVVTDSVDNDEPSPEKEKEGEEGKQRKSRKDKSNSPRYKKSNRERSKSREREASNRERSKSREREAREGSSSPAESERETSSIQEKTKSTESRRKATKDRETKAKDSPTLIREIIEPKGCGPLHKNEEEEQPSKQKKSLGILDMAAMAAMIPLVPIAAAYSCYTAEGTQSMLKNLNTQCTECKTQGEQAYTECKNSDDSPKNTTSEDERSSKRRSRKYMESMFHSDNDDDESAKSENESQKSAKSTNSKLPEQKKTIEESDENHGDKPRDEPSDSKSKRSGRSLASRSKKSLKILPQRNGKYDPPQTHIQEATEGFESFLPPQGQQCLSDPTSPASPALTAIIPGSPGIQYLPSQQKKSKKKTKKWSMPKLHFGWNKKADDKKADKAALPEKTAVLPPVAESAKAPERIPFLKQSKKPPPGDAMTDNALPPFWAERPAAATKAKKPSTALDGELLPFSCSQSSGVCGKVDLDREVQDDTDRSLLSDFENLALDALKKKSQKQKANETPDPAKATQEDLLNYYDLGQTLSDVMDARQTLEQAYGLHSGGGSFDHTIDEQLVELLAHMAEMDQEDVVEIEAAIKKLKRHARKLGISERDLLFSVKSADGSALSLADDNFLYRGSADEAEEEAPTTFGNKMYDAIFWRK